MRLTVASVWVTANVKYTQEYVANLRAMVARHLPRDHRFVCLTDRPHQVPKDVEPIAITHDPKLFGWWAKVHLFNPEHELGDRVLYLDLDTLIVDRLDPIVDYLSGFAAIPDAGSFQPRSRHQVIKKLNSSVMVWDNTPMVALNQLWDHWSPKVAERLWGDQDFIGERFTPDLMPIEWFPRLSQLEGRAPQPPAKVVLMKVPKPHIAADLYPWVEEIWRAA